TKVGAAGNDNARRFPPSVGIDHPEPPGGISFQDKLPFWWGPSLPFHVPPVLRRNLGESCRGRSVRPAKVSGLAPRLHAKQIMDTIPMRKDSLSLTNKRERDRFGGRISAK